MAALLAVCASVIFGVADFLGGLSARRIAPLVSAVIAQAVGLAALLLAGIALLGGHPIGADLGLGALAGVVGGVALGAFYHALAHGAMSVVAPLSAVTSATIPVVAGLLLGESPGATRWAGVALALPAVVLISREGDAGEPSEAAPAEGRATRADNRAAVLVGLAAGTGFGLFIVLITRTSPESGVWPLVSSRSASTIVLGIAVMATGAARRPPAMAGAAGAGLRLAVLAGVLDATSNMAILEAGRRGMLVAVGVIGAMYPASTIVLARIVLEERLQRHQLAGLVLAVAAVALIAV